MSGIAAAKWLASLAPPRAAAATGRPSSSLARASSGAVAASECIPGQRRISSASSATPPTLARARRPARARSRRASSARRSQNSSPLAGDDVERVARAHDRGDRRQAGRPAGRVAGRRPPARRRRARAARCARGRAPSPSARSGRARSRASCPPPCAARRRPRRRPAQLAGLEAQAGVQAGEARRRGANVRRAPLLVADEQQRDLGEALAGAAASARSAPRASTSPPFMSTVPEPTSCSPSRRERPVLGVRDDGVEVADAAGPAACRVPAGARRGPSAWPGEEHGHALDRRPRRAASAAHTRRALLGAVHVAGRRGHGHERLELARRAARDLRRAPARPTDPCRASALTYVAVPELPEMEITARRLGRGAAGRDDRVRRSRRASTRSRRSTRRCSALDGATFTGVRRRGKLLLLDVDRRPRPADAARAPDVAPAGCSSTTSARSLRDKTSRVLIRLPERPRAAAARVRHASRRRG